MIKLTERQLTVESMRNNGATYREIAKKLDVTEERVRQLIIAGKKNRAKQIIERNKPIPDKRYEDLSTREQNCICMYLSDKEKPTPEKTRELIDSGELSMKSPNVGVLTMKNINEWLKKYNA